MKVWPFMFAASRTLDYQFVALPEIFDVNSCGSLRDHLKMDEIDPRRIRTASLSAGQSGTLGCVYRSGPILLDDAVHVDPAGRKLLFAFGLVVEALPATLDKLSNVIDATEPLFERGLASFLNSNTKWTPIVTKSFELPIEPPAKRPDGLRKITGPVVGLSLVLLVALGCCALLYLKNRSLESQLIESKSQRSKPPEDGDLKNNPDTAPAITPRVPESELEKRGPLTIERPRQ
jgi:hypothetical protein